MPPARSDAPASPARPAHPRRRFTSLRAKFLWGTVLVTVVVMGALTVIVEQRQRGAIIREIERRGLALARNLAAMSTDPFLVYDFTVLEQNVTRMVETADVAYAIIQDLEGRVVAHSTHPEQVGSLLADPVSERASRADAPLVQETTAAGEPYYDFAIPLRVQQQRWGTVRLGLSRRGMEAEIARTRLELALLAVAILVAGGLASALVARRIGRPVRHLADGVAAVARGELAHRIEPSTSDEIGRLALAFNEMAGQVAEQRTALATSHTELSRRFGELSDLKSYNDSILGSLTSGVITLDLEGRVVTLNAAAESLLGWSLADARGRPCAEAFVQAPEVVELLMQTLRTRVGTPLAAVTLRRRDARAVPVEVTTAPLKGAHGNDLGVVAVMRDVTAVRQLEDQLRHAQKMEAVGRLAGGVAHDFNNLLMVITGRSQILQDRLAPDDPARRDIDVIQETMERGATLTRQLLAFSRKQVLQSKVVDLNAEVTGMKTMLRHLIGEDVALVTVLAPALGRVRADVGQLEQVLMNLAVNARDAMPQGGRLTIETRNVELDEAFVREHVGAQPGSHVLLAVSDTGVGMDAHTRAHLFEPFFTTKAPGRGTGLGLATVYGIVQQSGGHIAADSEPGRGATFRIYLPRVEAVPAAAAPPPAQVQLPHGSETVLLVEDEEAVRRLAGEVLQMHGYTVLEARHPGEALLISERHPGPIPLLVTDVVMPQMGGRELADRLLATRREMKVIFMSGYADDAALHQGVLEAGTAFLPKPVTPDALARKVRELLDGRPARGRPRRG